MIIRDADPERDASACAAIYEPYVCGSVASFEARAPTEEEMSGRIGAALYAALFEQLGAIGLWTLCAGITQPNDASNGLHRAMGFVPVGTYRRIGWKAGAWHDVQWWQLDLRPGEPGPPRELETS